VQEGVEACDDGNDNDDDGCSNSCAPASCGDGVVQDGEDCDDGDNSNTDDCLNACVYAGCGDGYVWSSEEECDDGNAVDGDGCESDCTDSPQQGKYTALGPQTNVPVASVTGWTTCFNQTYEKTTPTLATILAQCNKPNLMLACRKVGSSTYTLLAHAPRTSVIKDTGGSNTPTSANGSGWYYYGEYSWGFAKLGDPISLNTCDQALDNPGLRLCWHAQGGSIQGGYRCGASEYLNEDATWERLVLHAD
jgi:cysteine-rich repeat protein